MGRGGIEKVLHYLDDHLPAMFRHLNKTMEDCDMLSFLCGDLQVYLECWNSSDPFEQYVPDFMKASRCVQDECAHMITEIVSFIKHIRSYQYLPNINMVERMDNLQKLNMDLIAILDEYFSTNIWMPLQSWMSTSVQIYGCQTHWRIRNTCTVLCHICQTSQTDY